jgi:FkbM family methyltransferase
MIWARLKDAAIRAGLEPLLRPLVDRLRGKVPVEDDVAALALIMRLAPNAVCVDIGCNKGIFLDPMRRAAPNGRFFAFEPVPYLYDLLQSKYRSDPRVRVFHCALSSKRGTATLYVNTQDYGLSGLSDRPGCRGMDRASLHPVDVPVDTLDALLGDQHVDFIKIDVLQGARGIIARSRPLILFEFGLGGADYFGVDAAKMHGLLETFGYEVYTVSDYVNRREALTLPAFTTHFNLNSKYNFVAAPKRRELDV